MPPRNVFSRHRFSTIHTDDAGRRHLALRDRFLFRELEDNRVHTVSEGDNLQNIAARYYRSLPRPTGLWWILADFQPEPIHDPTIALTVGKTIIVPSLRTVQEQILNERRRQRP